jgi:hypothetical protein
MVRNSGLSVGSGESVGRSAQSRRRFGTARFVAGFCSGVLAGIVVSACVITIAFLIAVVLFAEPSFGVEDSSPGRDNTTEPRAHPQRAIGEYRRDLKAFVRKSKHETDDQVRIGAALDLCELHHELATDPRYPANEQIKGFRAVAAARLKNIAKEIAIELKRIEREKKKSKESYESGPTGVSPVSESGRISREEQRDDLSSWANSKKQAPPPMEFYHAIAADDLHLLNQVAGGPISMWGYVGGNFGGLPDYGPDLVRLIETTIDPDFWRSNGGSGVIYYYQPLRILVVSATTQIHDEMTDLLRTMRQMDR